MDNVLEDKAADAERLGFDRDAYDDICHHTTIPSHQGHHAKNHGQIVQAVEHRQGLTHTDRWTLPSA